MRRTSTTPPPMLTVHSLPPRPLRNNVRRAQAVVQAPINQLRRTQAHRTGDGGHDLPTRFVRPRERHSVLTIVLVMT